MSEGHCIAEYYLMNELKMQEMQTVRKPKKKKKDGKMSQRTKEISVLQNKEM
jgi:hypothetical protein